MLWLFSGKYSLEPTLTTAKAATNKNSPLEAEDNLSNPALIEIANFDASKICKGMANMAKTIRYSINQRWFALNSSASLGNACQ